MVFVDGYITVMGKELPEIRATMPTHLQELMEDGERYTWPAVMAYQQIPSLPDPRRIL